MDPDHFVGKPEEYLAWAKDNYKFSPSFCARHWMPCPVEKKPGLLASVIVMTEGFVFVPDDIAAGLPDGADLSSRLNSWQENQTVPVCCKLGDEKMAWLWWIVDVPPETLCKAIPPDDMKGIRVCWRAAGHLAEHEWERPYPRSVFDLMEEVHP